jgi:serine phosphatase RsbU (regulator of sigma subunit)
VHVAGAIMDAVDAFTAGAPQADDLTLIAVRRRPV